MGVRRRIGRLLPALWVSLAGCAERPLPGPYWNVEVTGLEDNCREEGVPSQERYEYRLTFTGSYTEVAIGPSTFAEGQLRGKCNDLNYQSVVWGQEIDGYEVRWQLTGEAMFDYGDYDQDCIEDEGLDWQGTETFRILSTGGHPDFDVDCTYVLGVEGVFAGRR